MSKPFYALRVDDHALEAWQMDTPVPIRAAVFAAGDHAAFGHWLARQSKGVRYRLLVDLADEALQLETLPRARGADRRALIVRRFATHFPSSPITWMHGLGTQADGGRFERLVMHGLTRATALEPWLDAIRRSGAQLEAICSATLLLGHFLPRTLNLETPVLLATRHRGGARLTKIADGCAQFSRLLPGIEPFSDSWRHEVERTRAYLATQHSDAGAPPRTIALVDDPEHDCPQAPADGIEFVAATALLAPAAPRLHASATASATACANLAGAGIETVLLRCLARAPARLNCRTRACPTTPRPSLRRLAALGCSAALAAAGLALAATRFAEAGTLDQAATALEAQSAAQRRETAALHARHGALAAPPEVVLDVLARLEREQAAHAPTRPVFETVAAALDASPGVELDQLSWQRLRSTSASAPIAVELRLHLPPAPAATEDALDRLTDQLAGLGAQAVDSETGIRPTSRGHDGIDDPVTARVRFQLDGSARQ